MVTVEIPDSALLAVKHRALENPTEEVCGIILRGEHFPIENTIYPPEQRVRRFRMNSHQQMEIWNRWRRDGDLIVYHSHPTGGTFPSDEDKWVITRSADVLFLIYGVKDDEYTVYKFNGFSIITLQLKVIGESTQQASSGTVTNGTN